MHRVEFNPGIWCETCGPHYTGPGFQDYAPVMPSACTCKVQQMVANGGSPEFISAGAICTAVFAVLPDSDHPERESQTKE